MRGMNKKILISLLTTLVVFITVFATTYAWVGIFTYANTDSFKMNLKVQDLDSNYFLTISSSGKPGTFSSEVPAIDLKRQIVVEKFGENFLDESDSSIERIFDDIRLAPVTTTLKDDNTLDTFYALEYNSVPLTMYQSDGYYKFDLYLSIDTKEGINENTTGIKANVLLNNIEETLKGTITTGVLSNGNPFLELPSDSGKLYYDTLKSIPTRYSVNSKNAVRIGLSVYNPITLDDQYNGDELPLLTKIYEGGNEKPLYDSVNNLYDLGGCLTLEENLAIQELFVIRKMIYRSDPEIFNTKMQMAIDRLDYELIDENKYLWNKREHESYLGCMDGVQTKMKISVFLWFEGWDADCLKLIEEQPVTLDLAFTSGTDD